MNLMRKPPLGLKTDAPYSTAIRNSARGETCALRLDCCNYNPATTVFCHIRQFGWAGMGQKPADFLGFYACSACHDAFDGRSRAPWGWDDITRAHGETLLKLHAKGLLVLK